MHSADWLFGGFHRQLLWNLIIFLNKKCILYELFIRRRHKHASNTSIPMLFVDFVCKSHSMFVIVKIYSTHQFPDEMKNDTTECSRWITTHCNWLGFCRIFELSCCLCISLSIQIIPDMHSHLIISWLAVKMLRNVHPVTIESKSKMQYIFKRTMRNALQTKQYCQVYIILKSKYNSAQWENIIKF